MCLINGKIVAMASGKKLMGSSNPKLRLLPKPEVTAEEVAVDAAVDAALVADFNKTVSALRRPISAVAAANGEEVGEVSADDAEHWWEGVAVPVLNGVAKRVVLSEAGQSPASVVDAAILNVITWLLTQHDEAETAAGALPPSHPARLKRLVLIVASATEALAVRDHALAMALVFSGVAARVVSGPINRGKLKDLVNLTQPAVIVVPKCPHGLNCPDGAKCPEREQIAVLTDLFPDIPLVEALGGKVSSKGFSSLVTRVLKKCPEVTENSPIPVGLKGGAN